MTANQQRTYDLDYRDGYDRAVPRFKSSTYLRGYVNGRDAYVREAEGHEPNFL